MTLLPFDTVSMEDFRDLAISWRSALDMNSKAFRSAFIGMNSKTLRSTFVGMNAKNANLLGMLQSPPLCSYVKCSTFIQAIMVGQS